AYLSLRAVPSREMTFTSFFFFFQAEDGIRDLTVTGVQTCALPISLVPAGIKEERVMHLSNESLLVILFVGIVAGWLAGRVMEGRSEERRVGKECRSRGWGEDVKEKGERQRGAACLAVGAT